MKRLTTTLAAVAIVWSVALPAFAGEPVPEFLDRFAEQAFDGNDGLLNFSGPWVEVGESNGPTSGFVWVWDHDYCGGTYCLKMGGSENDAEGHGAHRAVDLGGATWARLRFDDGRQLLDEDSGGTGVVQISSDAGNTWTTLDTISLDRDDGSVSLHEKYDISDFATPNTVIRFKITEANNLDAYWLIDNVMIEATFEPTTTTTTTTKAPEPTTTTTTKALEPTTTTTTHARDKNEKSDNPEIPHETTTTTVPLTITATLRTTTTKETPTTVAGGLPPEDQEMMMSKTALAVPAMSATVAMPAEAAGNSGQTGHHAEPVEVFAAAFLTEAGHYGGNLLPSIALGIVIAVVSLIGIHNRNED